MTMMERRFASIMKIKLQEAEEFGMRIKNAWTHIPPTDWQYLTSLMACGTVIIITLTQLKTKVMAKGTCRA
jgi:hypothetical protein